MSRTVRAPRIDVDALVEGACGAVGTDQAAEWSDRLRAAAIDAADDHDRARLLLARAATTEGSGPADLLADAEEAAALLESVGDLARRAQAETVAAELCLALDDVGACVDHAVDAAVSVERGVADEIASDVLSQLGDLWAGLLAHDEALRLNELAGAAARRVGSRWRVERSNLNLVETLVAAVRLERMVAADIDAEDRLVRAEGLARELCSVADVDDLILEGPRLLADVLCEQGRPEEAWLALLAAPPSGTEGYRLDRRLLVEARCLRLLGQPVRAITSLDAALAEALGQREDMTTLFVLDERSIAREAAGDAAGAVDDARLVGALLWRSQQRRAAVLARRTRTATQAELERRLVLRTAEQDPLTDVGNRLAFERRLDRSGDQTILSVLVVDLDLFELVNTVHGRPVGDEVLARVAGLVRLEVRDRDLVARYGGDEFGLVLDGLDLRAAQAVAERIRRRVAEHDWTMLAVDLHVTVSIGVVAGPGRDARRLLQRADVSLYEAKRAGRDRVAWAGG